MPSPVAETRQTGVGTRPDGPVAVHMNGPHHFGRKSLLPPHHRHLVGGGNPCQTGAEQ